MTQSRHNAPPGIPKSRPRVPFKCPICRSQVYIGVGDARDRRPVFECAGCTVMFRDPERFTRFEPYPSGIAAPDFTSNWKSSGSRDE